MNPRLKSLHPYPFQKLAGLKAGLDAPSSLSSISLAVGEPKHPPPENALKALRENLDAVSRYPSTRGSNQIRRAMSAWLIERFKLEPGSIDPDHHVLPVNGTREALFAIAQAVVDPSERNSLIICPNPFYQIYEGAAVLSGASVKMLNCLADNDFLPCFDELSCEELERCELMYLCTPGNPTGAVMSVNYLQKAIKLARQYNFVLVSDECYSELYYDSPPPGLLQAAHELERNNFTNCLVFHSLSKRSNLPGLRSGLVAGDKAIIEQFFQYRTYHGSAMSELVQSASIEAWSDELHVEENRKLYDEKFDDVIEALSSVCSLEKPSAGFYLWLNVKPYQAFLDTMRSGENKTSYSLDELFARGLYDQYNVTVLPGSYLSRDIAGHNPGQGFVRLALVAQKPDCIEAARRIAEFIEKGMRSA